ncbi:MAG: response regulator transcription factor [Trueperaceae bacterium]
MSRATVLLVEDDDAVRELVAYHLGRAGLRVVEAATAGDAWAALDEADLIVLDWMLPDESGVSLLRRIRTVRGHTVPVVMLTARAREAERIEGLESGADDYVSKPFSAPELVARVRAQLRRVEPQRRLQVGNLDIDVERSVVSREGEPIDLTRREFELLAFLATHPGKVFRRGELLDEVWGEAYVGTERTVDQHVAQLRARLGGDLIDTVRGRGYRLGSATHG